MAMEAYKYAIVDDVNRIFEEKANQFGAIRKIRWGDSDKTYLEIRKWQNTPDGGERASKGYTFMTEDGPDELINNLLDLGYGNTKEVLEFISERTDFRKSLNSVLGKDDEAYDADAGTLEDDYFDPKSFLGD